MSAATGPPRRDSRNETANARLPPWSTALVRLMDDFIRVPGTEIRLGLDALLGLFFPGAGDVLSATSGVALLLLAFAARVPGVVIARMAMNTIFDALLGAVPLVGDIFDVAWKANRKNLKLIERFQRPNATARPMDYVAVTLSLLAVLAAVTLPIFVIVLLVRTFAQ